MNLDEMESRAKLSLAYYQESGGNLEYAGVTLVFPRGWKAPPKFPRGELLMAREDGTRVRSIPSLKLLKWVEYARKQIALIENARPVNLEGRGNDHGC